MHPIRQETGEHLVDDPVTGDARRTLKGLRHDRHVKMRLTFRTRTRMTGMQMGLVRNFKTQGRKLRD